MVEDPLKDEVCSSQQVGFSETGYSVQRVASFCHSELQIDLRDYISDGQNKDEDVWDLVGLVHMDG